MAEVHQLHTSFPALQEAAAAISSTYGGIRGDETNWMVNCPIHDDKQASLHIQVTDRLLVFCHVCGKDKQKDLIARLKKDDLWPDTAVQATTKPVDIPQSNIPAHATPSRFPEYLSHEGLNYPITKIWTYRTETGHPAFWILRADTPKGKAVKPFSSFTTPEGENVFKLGLQSSKRPLYNLVEIVSNLQKTILVVEGEKAADAAALLFPEYTATTWSGGKNGLKNTDVSQLIGRNVVVWPDNDEPGIIGMVAFADIVPNTKFVFQEVQEILPAKWDVADQTSLSQSQLLEMLHNAKPYVRPVEEDTATIEYLMDKWQKVEDGMGGTSYYDTHSRSHDRRPEQPFKMYNSKSKLQEAEPKMKVVYVDGEPKRMRVIDKYLDDATQPHAVGLTFDPTTKDVRVIRGSTLYLNTFMGIENAPAECDPALYKPFLAHLEGILDIECCEYMLNFFADIFQNIGRKPGVMPILKGKPGSGKSIVGELISAMLGNRIAKCIPCGKVFDSSFNGMLTNKVFVSLDELNLYGAANKNANEDLKTMVTDPYMSVNKKFTNQYSEKSYHRFMATTNIDHPVHIDSSDRRFAVFDVKDTFIGNYDHFEALGKIIENPVALSGLAYYFNNRHVTTNVKRMVETQARTLIMKPEDPILAMIQTWLNDAELPSEIKAQLPNCKWPEHTILVHRNILTDYIVKKHPSFQGLRPAIKLLDHFRWSRDDGGENNTVKMDVFDLQSRTVVSTKARVFEIKNVHAQRRIYENITNTKPEWSKINFVDEKQEITNVVPITGGDIM